MIFLNGNHLGFEIYPNNELILMDIILPHVRYDEQNVLRVHYVSDLDLSRLMLVSMWIRDLTDMQLLLEMPYLPYSRMDRSQDDSGFSLKYLCEFINWLDFDTVVVEEAHSDVSLALLERVVHIQTSPQIALYAMSEIGFTSEDYILYPDEGARIRYQDFFSNEKVLVASKVRHFRTGEITGLEIFGDVDLNGNRVMIVDDLCSKGGSFWFSAKELKKMGAGEIFLSVTHCEDTIHDGKLLRSDLISRIFTTDSILSYPHRKITIRKSY